ncbi:DUF1499 domain-containing protein [Botrimarina sp.]|uniref:DUF1499 domain-containing protein n=1 Tax=Botrimarina sp. TaxID=2795802 RepID=UPI0032F003A3
MDNAPRSAAPTESPKRRRVLYLVLAIAVLAPLVVVALSVDDWSRDLTTNRAATAIDHPDERLRPRRVAGDAARVEAALERFVSERRAWRIADEKELPGDSPLKEDASDAVAVWRLVHTTGLMRFRDDVWLVVLPADAGGVLLAGESRSRVGKGDLGQNPRNLDELLSGLAERIAPVTDR